VSEGAIQIQQAELVGQVDALAEALASELSARLGRTLAFVAAAPQTVGVLELAETDEPVVHQTLLFADAEGGVHVVLPQRDAALLAALEAGESGEALASAVAAPLDEAATAKLAQVMESVSDVLQRGAESAGLPALAVGEIHVVATPQSEPTWLDDTLWFRLRFAVRPEGLAAGRLDLLFRKGDLVGSAGAAGDGARSVCFVIVGEAQRKKVAEIEGELGGNAVTLEPSDFAKPLDERVLESHLVVIPWDLAGRSGLELAEFLVRDERLGGVPILLAAARPTRAQVFAALRAGARAIIPDAFDPAAVRAAAEAAQ
jgi:CheY-like chemotaxis protein